MCLFNIASLLLYFTSVQAGVLRRDIAPYPANATVETATVDFAAQVSAYNEALTLSGSVLDPGNVTLATIHLVNFDGCADMPNVGNAEAQIYSGWQQAQKIMALKALKDGDVDCNTAGALEYLGAAGLNALRQSDMSTIFKNFATLTPAWWPFGWRIHVRCDDPLLRCTYGSSMAFAYTSNYYVESKLARINFCPLYFETPSLNAVLDSSKNLPASQNYDMARYRKTQGHVWAHKLMHIDWVTGAYGPAGRYGHNEHVVDITIQFKDSKNRDRKVVAKGAEFAKILARWPTNTGDYTIRNADNLALFMTSQYVQSKLGNAYPQYPVIDVDQPDRPPSVYSSLFIFDSDGRITLNDTNPLAAAFADADATECALDEDEPNTDAMIFSSFAPDSAYPSDYISSVDAWIASETWAPDSDMTAPPALSTSAASSDLYCVPFQDPDHGVDGYCRCSDGANYSFASGDNVCPYTSPGPTSATIDPATVTGTGGIAAPITTTPPPAPPPPSPSDICGDWYRVFFDRFEIYGKNFDAAKFEDDGAGLKEQITGCGDLTRWNFQYLQDDPNGMQWYASGRLPIGTKACVGRAVVSAGGSGPDRCTGAG